MRKFTALSMLVFSACGGSSGGKKAPDGSAPGPSADGGQSIIASGLSCPAVKPCGGNPVGTWNITNFCLAGLGEEMAAQSQTDGGVLSGSDKCLTDIRLVVDGTIEFQADGTYATKNRTAARLESKFNDSCLRNQGQSCSQQAGCGAVGADGVCTCFKDEPSDSGPNLSTSSGVFMAARDVLYTAANENTYASTLTTSACSSFPCDVQKWTSIDLVDYCVDGDTMKFVESDGSGLYTVITAVRASGPGTIAVSPLPTKAPDSPAPVAAPTAVNAGDPPVTFNACGGNIVGTWNISKLSLASSSQVMLLKYVRSFDENGECATAVNVTDTGILVFQPHSSNFTGGAGYCSFAENPVFAVSYSTACLAAKAKSCDDLDKSLKAETVASDATAVVGCALASGDVCACAKTHQYSFADCEYDTSSLWLDFYTAPVDTSVQNVIATDTHNYCVSGNTLSVQNSWFRIGGLNGLVVMTAVRADSPATGLDAGTDVSRPDATAGRLNADAGAPDNRIADVKQDDASLLDAMPIDATPVPLSTMPPSMAATCQAAATAPCGGDLTGNWNVVGICDQWLNMTEFLADWGGNCPTSGDYIDHGTVALNADGTCLFDEVTTYEIDKSVSCLAQKSMTCDSMNQTFADAVGTNEMISGGCALSTADNCHCEKVFSSPDTCKYMTTATTITTVNLDGTNEWGPYPYCVQGNALTIFIPAWSATGTALNANAAFFMTRAN